MSKRIYNVFLMLCLLSLSSPVFADAAAAKHRYFAKLAQINTYIPGVDQSRAIALPTLVRGMYELRSQQGEFITYFNESASLKGDYRKFQVMPTRQGAEARQLSESELDTLRREIMANIDYERLIPVRYGAGGGRRLLVFSAVDCGYCQKMEESLRKNAKAVNTTFYVIPMSIKDIDRDGSAAWHKVSQIWCAENSGQAWRAYWQSGTVPSSGACEIDARGASSLALQLKDILSAVGVRVSGTPAVVREDGSKFTPSVGMTPAELAANYGPTGLPQPAPVEPYWLADAGDTDSSSTVFTGGSILDLGGLLKKIIK